MSQRMMMAIGAGVLVLALVVGGLVFWRMRATAPAPQQPSGQSASRPTPEVPAGETPTPAEQPAARGCAERESAAACSDADRFTAAVAAKDAAQCADIGDAQPRDLCVSAAAEAAADPSQCDRIGDDGIRSRCDERAATAKARAEGSVTPCAALAEAARASCRAAVFATLSGRADCDRFADDAEDCRAYFGEEMDLTGSGPRPEELPESGDVDGDGLTNGRERDLGTNPRNKDTDGDTFPDGDEVKNGYNPLGPGRLETSTP